jgi:flagellar basal body-associated protein FliL
LCSRVTNGGTKKILVIIGIIVVVVVVAAVAGVLIGVLTTRNTTATTSAGIVLPMSKDLIVICYREKQKRRQSSLNRLSLIYQKKGINQISFKVFYSSS